MFGAGWGADLFLGPVRVACSQLSRVFLEVRPLELGWPVTLDEQQPESDRKLRLGMKGAFQDALT
ncbi:hypothetical protein BFF78_36305 [Streptomyces fodineus]|uniref:Uncharacterized protein n=1 Tax=Streptomyces fodineus TaxID=1904616 RepID=A0A1D7YJN4_9ACTN|nr:hypothetical protein BFF78_36305 [Streptomyces fodineus]